jgi:bacteriorhodopsin
MLKLFSNKKVQTLVMALALVAVLAPMAFANTQQGTEFQSLYDRVISWITGMPAIIIAIGMAIVGVVRAFQVGSFMWALGGLLVAALVFALPTIIAGMGGACI